MTPRASSFLLELIRHFDSSSSFISQVLVWDLLVYTAIHVDSFVHFFAERLHDALSRRTVSGCMYVLGDVLLMDVSQKGHRCLSA